MVTDRDQDGMHVAGSTDRILRGTAPKIPNLEPHVIFFSKCTKIGK